MRKIFFLIIVATIIITGCISKIRHDEESMWKQLGIETPPIKKGEQVEYLFTGFPPSAYTKDRVALYELKEDYYAVMDSVVWSAINASGNKHRKLGFVFQGHKEDDGSGSISVHPIEYRTLHTEEEAIFYYNGFQFNYEDDFLDEMFVVKDSITIWKIDPRWWNKLLESDHLGGSYYILENGKLIPDPLYSDFFE